MNMRFSYMRKRRNLLKRRWKGRREERENREDLKKFVEE